MSSDAFGFPPSFPFSKDVILTGQLGVGNHPLLMETISWSRADSVVGSSRYLTVEVPPLWPGTVIQAAAVCSAAAAGDVVGLGISQDPFVAGTTVTFVNGVIAALGLITFMGVVRNGNDMAIGYQSPTNNTMATVTTADFHKNNRLVLYVVQTTGITIGCAWISVSIPRIQQR